MSAVSRVESRQVPDVEIADVGDTVVQSFSVALDSSRRRKRQAIQPYPEAAQHQYDAEVPDQSPSSTTEIMNGVSGTGAAA